MKGEPLHLPDGGSVGIIGAGPAGSFFALHLMANLRAAGRTARIALIDRKTFDSSGPSGCNMCAGAIGAGMVRKIEMLDLPFDQKVIRRIADGYEIHGRSLSVMVRRPDRGEIYTVFRGGGPVVPTGGAKSFDQFLLDAAVARGAEFIHERVDGIEPLPGGWRLRFPGGGMRDFDFLAGGFGVNTTFGRKLGIGYVPPKTWHTVQAEIPAGNDFIVNRLGNRIHIVAAGTESIRFIAITPKDDFLTVTGIGEHVKIADFERERRENVVLGSLLPEGAAIMCHCHPQVPVGIAKRPFARGIGIVGDAFISRYLKNGIESSYDTSRVLAEAVVRHGVSREALREHFYRPCVRMFGYDNVWGKALFGIYERVLRRGRLSDAFIGSVANESGGGIGYQGKILWSVFAGDAPYREIARDAVGFRSIAEILRSLVRG